MLDFILRQAMEQKEVSAREVARQTGVAHTTVIRILHRENVDLDTIKKICAWLKIDPMYVVNLESGLPDKEWLWKLGMLIESNGVIHIAMKRVFRDLDLREITPRIINDIGAYIVFAIRMHRYEL